MKKPSNNAKAIYLIWGLIQLILLLSSPKSSHGYNNNTGQELILYYPTLSFYPFTKNKLNFGDDREYVFENFDLQFYDFTEFAFYMIAPILIYYIITLFKTKDEA